MARILYWNVRDFTNNKIVNNARPPDAPHGFAGLRQGPARLAFMLNCFSSGVLGGGAFLPDFIVIVEVEKGLRNLGQGNLVSGNAATGIVGLLNAIRLHGALNAAGQDWRLVPPAILGRRGQGEGVAVFYNAAAWYFMGPDGRGAVYPAPFANALPVRQIPVGYPLGKGNQWENRFRGQWHFTAQKRSRYDTPSTIYFPTRNSRHPWLTCFGSVAGPPHTYLRLMSMHTSPAFAQLGTSALSYVSTMMGPNWSAANQIDLILGDFNVDNLDANEWAAGGAYSHLVGTGVVRNANPVYTPTIRPPAAMAAQFDSYYWTESPTTLANCVVDDGFGGVDGFAPGYGYLVRSIDNIFYRKRGLPAPPANANSTIVNRAVGTIYPAAGPPAPAPYRGAVTYLPTMNTPMANILGNVGHMINDANEELQEWDNYGLIQSTSDHLPLVAEI